MIEVFKLVHGFYDKDVNIQLSYKSGVSTRGNKYKLENYSFHYNIRKYSFCPRIVNIWNSLPNSVVDVETVNIFKAHLDKFWEQQPVWFNFRAELTGIGDRFQSCL